MAKIEFSSENAFQRFTEMSQKTRHMEKSLDSCVLNLMKWNPWDATIRIGCDFDELSFSFREILPDGRAGICGGIIFHGSRDGFGAGDGPTHSVTLEPTDGYAIHT